MGISTARRKCFFCKKTLDPLKGRTDRKFCDDLCRSAYHNKKKQDIDPEIVRINKILQKNFDILEECLGKEHITTRSKEELFRMGFSFDYYTQISGEYKYCYFYGYILKVEKYVMIVKGFDSIVRKL